VPSYGERRVLSNRHIIIIVAEKA